MTANIARCIAKVAQMPTNTRSTSSLSSIDPLLHAAHGLTVERLVHGLDLVLHALDRLEVLDGLDMELSGRVLVDDDERPGVELEGGEGPEVVDALLDGLGEREGLALAGDDDDDLAGLEHGRDADGERHARHGGDVVVEEAGVGEDGVVCERLDARARGERGAWRWWWSRQSVRMVRNE